MLKLLIVAAVIWWLFLRNKAQASTVFQGVGGSDFDLATADQFNAAPTGTVGFEEDTVTFITGNGNWADIWKTRATSDDDLRGESLGLPL